MPAFADREYNARENGSLDMSRPPIHHEITPPSPTLDQAKNPSRKHFRHSLGSSPAAVRPRESFEQAPTRAFENVPMPSSRPRADSSSRPASRNSYMMHEADDLDREPRPLNKRASWGANSHHRSQSVLEPAREADEIPPMPALPAKRSDSD
jgi:hypothetical protein